MLTTTITYNGTLNQALLNDPLLHKCDKDRYDIYLSSKDKKLGELILSNNIVTIQFSSELPLDDLKIVHNFILHLQQSIDGEIDDSNSFLGYLPNGESVYITKNWEQWIRYIFQSMKNCQSDTLHF